jgi:hypothetical protein
MQLCYLAGVPTAEAAQRLGWPKGTVLTRLAWARQRIQKCLVRRGMSPAVLLGPVGPTPAFSHKWACVTARAAKGLLAGEAPGQFGVSLRTISLSEGVVRAMIWERFRNMILAAIVVVGLAGYGFRQWVSATDLPGNASKSPVEQADRRAREKEGGGTAIALPEKDPTQETSAARPGPAGRRREAVIRLPSGTFVKEVDAPPYGTGRLTWTYEDERVLGIIECSIMGIEVELATEAEYSLSSNGTIYGLITSTRVNHLRFPDGEPFAALKPFLGLWPAVEPLVNEVLIDLPFSYQFRVQGDRLIISNFRMLLAGPNPLGKLGGLASSQGNNSEAVVILTGFQALGAAIEGTYLSSDGKENSASKKRPTSLKFHGKSDIKTGK